MHQDVHDVVVHLLRHPALGPPGEQHELDAQQRHQDQRGPHRLHVQVGFRLVGHFELSDEDADDI